VNYELAKFLQRKNPIMTQGVQEEIENITQRECFNAVKRLSKRRMINPWNV
jgi:hypothetical protein